MVKKADVKAVATYNGHSIKPNGNVDLNMKFAYDELVNYLQLVQMLNNDINVMIKMPEMKAFKLGIFKLKNLRICDDGEGMLQLNSMTDFVEIDNLNSLVGKEIFVARFVAEMEIESEDEEEE